MTRRKTTRVYRVNSEQYVHISKEWSMKFGQNIYYVTPWPADGRTLVKVPTFAEARQYVKDLQQF